MPTEHKAMATIMTIHTASTTSSSALDALLAGAAVEKNSGVEVDEEVDEVEVVDVDVLELLVEDSIVGPEV
eukprot:m.26434 g.26434  ORF g.26434 m.26434 type:complete len:71 (+) comp11749_c0_seq1:312-524(+)